MLPAAFEPFVKEGPFCVLARAALESLFAHDRLDALFERTAERQYTRELLFSQLVELMTAVVLRQQPSVRAAFLKGVGNITVSDQAVYDKLARVEPGVCAALVRDSALRLGSVVAALRASHRSWAKGYRIRILDGNALGATDRRIAETRSSWDTPLPGRALVVFDPRTELATDVVLTPDGHQAERSLLGDVLRLARRRDLWVADRNFCTAAFLAGLDDAGAGFVIRQHGGLGGHPSGRRRRVGRTETGVVYEQPLGVGVPGRVLVLRRVTVELDAPTRDGDTAVHVLTNVPGSKADAVALSEVYRRRWTIEGRFLEMSQVLDAEPRTLGYPSAALFAFCLGLVSSNAVALLRAVVRATHGRDAADALSSYAVALDMHQLHRGMMVALPAEAWAVFRDMTPKELAAVLREVARAVDLRRYRKTTRGPKKPPPKKRYSNGGHVSTYRLLQQRNE
jgi:Transposase DDE domain